ncbi:MAG: hypothetical protein IV086_03700 [Hyphomonadaceae bacterium]|nr:hypothetical protein [Hyphomonadaceae bacterium]
MAAAPDLNGPIGDVLERAKTHVLKHMPRDYRGHALDTASISIDQDRRAVNFTWPDGAKAIADAQVVGAYVDDPSRPGIVSWHWGWSNRLFRAEMLQHAQKLKAYGETHRVDELLATSLEGRAERCWGYAMLAAVLNGAEGVTGLPSNGAMVLLTVGPLRAN